MHADLFYEIHNPGTIPLYLISQEQWKKEGEYLSSAHRNSFGQRQFTGKSGDYCFIYNHDGLLESAYFGSGAENQQLALAYAATQLPVGSYQLQEPLKSGVAIFWALAQYRFIRYKKYELQPRKLVLSKQELQDTTSVVNAVFLVRDLINTPPNDMGPAEMAMIVEDLAKTYNAEFKQWIGNELLADNFPAIHAVGRASASAPRLLSLSWGNKAHPHITLIGKGVCFDSGGLDIKPASNMRLMKKDMGGAAHVIGLAQWIMQQRLPIRLEVLIPAIENAVGPDAFRPGDILTMRNGLTVEIDNTDAEGRLILADALVKACEEQPELIIDFATLTGAARVALGTDIAAMFSNNDALALSLTQASLKAVDPVWRMPLFAAYDDLLSSNIADMTNSTCSPYAGAITAGLFLQRYVPKTIPWVHFDVMAWNTSNKPGKPEGGEALGLRAVMEYLLQNYGTLN